ncbi:Prenylcysteine lyase-domain-containing protein [Jimgerdemannia flammicorona]|uniref:Prenylcysteine lyase-domain-containing protein n=1 Tax=Jimgerdemannia flammicorona TaxID=994334 RepID=A0A433QYA5_9FUNG|nr:Prenylcysteine lyase-domain-containing protein [Jimgerdemannia flammicorona]
MSRTTFVDILKIPEMTHHKIHMRRVLVSAVLSLCLVSINAIEAQPVVEKRVAIIGSGAGGSSAAYWLSRAFPSSGDIKISSTVFEALDRVGGRSITIPIMDDPANGVAELGASIFVEVNWNMMNATKKFGLELKKLGSVDSRFGLWNGKEFIFQETGNSWWDTAKGLFRYGIAPFRVRNLVLSATDRLAYAYDHSFFPAFTNLKTLTSFLNFGEETSRTARHYLITDSHVKASYIEQIVQSATRVNYGQNIDRIHALGALVSMAANGAKSVKGGNWQIFQKFIEESGAKLRLETRVVGIKKLVDKKTGTTVYEVESEGGEKEMFDAVIVAAPVHNANINFNNVPSSAASALLDNPPAFETIHVTFVAGQRDPSYFGVDNLETLPNMVVTTADTTHFPGGQYPFTTFAEHHFHNDSKESIVKIFSNKEISDSLLDSLFVSRSWTFRHAWQAYPTLIPILDAEYEKMAAKNRIEAAKQSSLSISTLRDIFTNFLREWGVLPQKKVEVKEVTEEVPTKVGPFALKWPPIVLDEEHEGEGDGGVFYVNAFENWISTMETETISSKNIVRLLHKQWCPKCEPFGDGWTEQANEQPSDAVEKKNEL